MLASCISCWCFTSLPSVITRSTIYIGLETVYNVKARSLNRVLQAKLHQILNLLRPIVVAGEVERGLCVVERQHKRRRVGIPRPRDGPVAIRVERRGEANEVVAQRPASEDVGELGTVRLGCMSVNKQYRGTKSGTYISETIDPVELAHLTFAQSQICARVCEER